MIVLLVKEIMNDKPIFVEVPSNRKVALSILLKNEVSSAPVVRKGKNTLTGMISINELTNKSETDQTALIMNSRPPKVKLKDPIQKAAKAIIKSGFRAVPVVDDEGKLIGIVSVEDLLFKGNDEIMFGNNAESYVSYSFASAWIQTPLAIAYKIMKYYGSETLTLIDDHGNATNFMTEFDFLRELEEEYSSTKSFMQASSEGEDWDWSVSPILYMGTKALTFPNKKLSDVKSRKLPIVPSGTPVKTVVEEMQKNNSPQVGVGNDRGIKGIVFDLNLVEDLLIP